PRPPRLGGARGGPRPPDGGLRRRARGGGGRRGGRGRGAAPDCGGGRGGRARGRGRARARGPAGRDRLSAVTAVRARALAVPAWFWLASIVAASIVVRAALAHRIVAPGLMVGG